MSSPFNQPHFRVLTTWLCDHRFRVYGLFIVLFLMVLRAPELLLEPRFWAEEGNIYFRHSYMTSLPHALLYVYPNAGYMSLASNMASIVASRIVPIEAAPTATTYLSLAYQMIPFIFVLWGRAALWQGTLRKVLACALLLFVPNSGYVWLDTINLQSWCGLVTFCILMEPLADLSRTTMAGLVSLLAFNCLTGGYSLFLFPVFALKFFFERGRENLWIMVTMIVCGAFQAGAASASLEKMNKNRRSPEQITLHKPTATAFAFHMTEPILGRKNAARKVYSKIKPKPGGPKYMSFLPTLMYISFFMLLLPWRRKADEWWPPLAWLCSSVFTTLLAFNFHPTGRYSALPGFIFVCLLLSRLDFDWRRQTRGFLHKAQTVMCLVLISGCLINGSKTWRQHDYLTYDAKAPHWTTEIQLWREDSKYKPKIWPYKNRQWSIFFLIPRSR